MNKNKIINQAIKQNTSDYYKAKSLAKNEIEVDRFNDEGKRKSKYIIDYIDELISKKSIDVKKSIFIDVGAADGSLLFAIQNHYTDGFYIFNELSEDYILKIQSNPSYNEKIFKVFSNDISSQKDKIAMLLTELRENKEFDTVILSCQAVLHELPSRSKNFEFDDLLNSIFKGFDKRLFFSREPILPSDSLWSDGQNKCLLKIPEISSENIATFAREFTKHHRLDLLCLDIRDEGFVKISNRIAIELLMKLTRDDSIDIASYEFQEVLTSNKKAHILSVLSEFFDGFLHVKYKEFCTDGLFRAVKKSKPDIRFINTDGSTTKMAFLPCTHIEIVCENLNFYNKKAKLNLVAK